MSAAVIDMSSIMSRLNQNEVTVDILPEKKGYIKRHVEYEVYSSKFNSQVVRRYSDFLAFHDVMTWRFPNRIIPPIPPQKLSALVRGTDSGFAEERRKGLLRWLKVILVHPIICLDPTVEYFLTRIVDDMSTSIRDNFRSIPDEFVTGPLGSERAIHELIHAKSTIQSLPSTKDQIEPFLSSIHKFIQVLEKSSLFGHDKKEDATVITKELQNMGNLQSKSAFLAKNWAGSQDNLVKITSELSRIGSYWKDFALGYDSHVIEPLKILQISLQGYKELVERCHSDKMLNMEHKKNAEKIQNMRQRKITGLLASSPEIISIIEDRIGQLHVDDLQKRKTQALLFLTEETEFIMGLTELLNEAIVGICQAEQKGLQKVVDGWNELQPSMAKIQKNKS